MTSRLLLPLSIVLAGLAAPAAAKLPPLSEEAKAKAAEATARTGWTNKVAEFQLCKTMDRVAATYQEQAKQAGKAAPAPVATPPCADPGPFSYAPAPTTSTPAEPRPLEVSGAHSPAKTAAQPPSTNVPAATAQPTKK
jgi:hypothetical protein